MLGRVETLIHGKAIDLIPCHHLFSMSQWFPALAQSQSFSLERWVYPHGPLVSHKPEKTQRELELETGAWALSVTLERRSVENSRP